MNDLPNLLINSINPNDNIRVPAEQMIEQSMQDPGFPILLLETINSHIAGVSNPDKLIRMTAGVHFKNCIRKYWDVQKDEDGNIIDYGAVGNENVNISNTQSNTNNLTTIGQNGESVYIIPDTQKTIIRENIVTIMCEVPDDVQKVLCEALALISNVDFPNNWQSLLPEMISQFNSGDFHKINGVLTCANAIFKRYRYAFRSDEVLLELKYILEKQGADFAEQLTLLFVYTYNQIDNLDHEPDVDGGIAKKAKLEQLMTAIRLISRIFYSLNCQDVPEYFEDNMHEWMPRFLSLLSYKHALLESNDDNEKAGVLEAIHSSIISIVKLYADKYDEEFEGYVGDFATSIWELLKVSGTSVYQAAKYDNMMTEAMKFLTSLVSRQLHASLFSNEQTLREMIDAIVIPNILVSENDEELFEDNPLDYTRRDMEGTDVDTRRRCACDLVKGMGKHFGSDTSSICVEYIGNMIATYNTNPESEWKQKDAAILLAIAFGAQVESNRGVSVVNENLNVLDFLGTYILPELQNEEQDPNYLPMLRATCLKFITTFRNQVDLESMKVILPVIARHLGSQYVVLQTYSAWCLEKILAVKDSIESPDTGKITRVTRFTKENLLPYVEELLTNLFAVLDVEDSESSTNEYIMKVIMRLITIAQEDIAGIGQLVIEHFTKLLLRHAANPSNPSFNHYLFESIAITVRSVCKQTKELVIEFENLLFEPFELILTNGVDAFVPYVFQVLALLLFFQRTDSNTASNTVGGVDVLSEPFQKLFAPLLAPSLWLSKANIPGLTNLIVAYLHTRDKLVYNHLDQVLGIFDFLLKAKGTTNDQYAFEVLTGVIDILEESEIQKFLPNVMAMVLEKLQRKQPRFIRLSTLFMGTLIGKKGPSLFINTLESLQPGLVSSVVSNVWLPNVLMAANAGGNEAKACVVGLTRLIIDSVDIQDTPELVGAILSGATVITCPEETGIKRSILSEYDEDNEETAEEKFAQRSIGGEGAYTKLYYATFKDEDIDYFSYFPSIKSYFGSTIAEFYLSNPDKFHPIFQTYIEGDKRPILQKLMILNSTVLQQNSQYNFC